MFEISIHFVKCINHRRQNEHFFQTISSTLMSKINIIRDLTYDRSIANNLCAFFKNNDTRKHECDKCNQYIINILLKYYQNFRL